MNAYAHPLPDTSVADEDLDAQARQGFGVPSQDPRPAAQLPLTADESARESQSVLAGGGLVGGAATGAAIGVAVAGPVGVVVGGAVGAVVGAVIGSWGGAAAGAGQSAQAAQPGQAAAAAASEGPGRPASPPAEPVRLHIEDSGGGGRPVVLIHGWPLSAQSWASQVSALCGAGYRVVAYDRRGFGRSDKPESDYSYDTLVDDLQHVIDSCGLQDVSLVGFSMGGGEVARYIARCGETRLRSVVFAAAVPPCLMQSADNPDGPLTPAVAQQKKLALQKDRSAYFDDFTRAFFSADGVLKVSETQRLAAVDLCHQSAQHAALACMDAFATTDFRGDLKKITVPTLVLHGKADAIVPIAGSGLRTHRAVPHSTLVAVAGAPHGFNVSHAGSFNDTLLSFLQA